MSEKIKQCLGDCNDCDEPIRDLCAIYKSQERTYEIKHLLLELKLIVIPVIEKIDKQNEMIHNLIVENSQLKKSVPRKEDKLKTTKN